MIPAALDKSDTSDSFDLSSIKIMDDYTNNPTSLTLLSKQTTNPFIQTIEKTNEVFATLIQIVDKLEKYHHEFDQQEQIFEQFLSQPNTSPELQSYLPKFQKFHQEINEEKEQIIKQKEMLRELGDLLINKTQ